MTFHDQKEHNIRTGCMTGAYGLCGRRRGWISANRHQQPASHISRQVSAGHQSSTKDRDWYNRPRRILDWISLFGGVVCYLGHVIYSSNKVTWLTVVPAQGLQSQIRKCLQWLLTKNAMYELVYPGRAVDRHKKILLKSKIYMTILRKSFHSIVKRQNR